VASTNETSRLAIIVGVEGVERAAADLAKFERAVQEAKQKSTAGPASQTLSSGAPATKADQDFTQIYRNNQAALDAYNRGLERAGQTGRGTTAQYRELSTTISDTTKRIQALTQATKLNFSEVAPRPTTDLFAETQYLRQQGLSGSLSRNSDGRYVGLSAAGETVTPPSRTREGAATSLRDAELAALVQKGELAAAELAGLATGTRYLKEQQQAQTLASRDASEADRALAKALREREAAERKAEAAARRAGLREDQLYVAGQSVAGTVRTSPYRPTDVEGLARPFAPDPDGIARKTVSDLGPLDDQGRPTTDAARLQQAFDYDRQQTNLRRQQVNEAALQIERAALTDLRSRYGTTQGRSSAEVERSFINALESRRVSLEQVGLFNDVTPAVKRLADGATKGARTLETWGDSVHALEERNRLQLSFQNRGPLGQQIGGFVTDFQQGFRGRRDLPYGEQLGQVAKFSLLYGAAYSALFQLSQGIQLAIQNSIEYNAAIIELSISTGRSQESVAGLAESLGDISSAYGFSPAEGVQAGARAVGIFGLNDASQPTQDFYARAFTEATAQLAFVTGRTFEQVGQDLGAITQGFGLPASSVGYVQDLDAYFAKQFGSLPGGTLETTAQIGSLGAEAGFSIEEVSALASLLQSRTGQTPAATAGFLSQFFGRAGDPALRQKFAELGIDISLPFRDQIEQLSGILSDGSLGEGLRLEIINAFGRGRSGQAAAIIAGEFPNVAAKAEAAKTDAAGAGEQQFQERLNSVGGQLKQLGGATLELLKNIGESGLLDAFGLLIIVTKELVQAANTVLEAFSLIPREVRDVIIAIAAWRLALHTDIGRAAVGSALGTTARGTALAQRFGLPVASSPYAIPKGVNFPPPSPLLVGPSSAYPRSPYQIPPSLKPPLAAPSIYSIPAGSSPFAPKPGLMARASAGIAAGGAALAGVVPPALAAVAALYAIGSVKQQAEDFEAAMSDATASLATIASNDPEVLTQAADNLRSQADEIRKADGFWLNLATVGIADRQSDQRGDQLEGLADYIDKASEAEAAYLERQAQARDTSVFGDVSSVDDVTTGLQELAATGASSAQQFNLLSSAMRGMGEAASDALTDVELIPGRIARAFYGVEVSKEALGVTAEDLGLENPAPGKDQNIVSRALAPLLGTTIIPGVAGGSELGSSSPYTDADLKQRLFDVLPPEQIEQDLKDMAANGPLTQENINAYFLEAITNADLSEIGGVQLTDEQEQLLKDVLVPFYTDALASTVGEFDPNRVYNATSFTRQLNENLRPSFEAKLAQFEAAGQGEGTEAYEGVIKQYLRTLRQTKIEGPKGSNYFAEIRAAEVRLAQAALTRIEGAREVAQAAAETDKEFRAIGRRYLKRELNTAIQSRSIALISAVINRSSESVVRNVRGAVQADLVAARAAYKAALRAIEWVQRGSHLMVAADAAAQRALEVAAKQVRALEKQMEAFRSARDITVPERTALIPPEDLQPDPVEDTGPTQAQIDASKAIAEATRRGGQISLATAELQSARADLAAAEEGTVEYYQALAGVYEAQRSLAEAIRDDRINQFLLSNDITDPVVQAQAELKRARSQLRYDKAQGASPELIREDRLAVEQAQASKEAAKFQQWLSDLQTAENLERISHAAYIRHLERRSERLSAIKNRTRQEQDELDQVDAALKAAKEAVSGQFNIGNIRVPTPYEVRRFIEQQQANNPRYTTPGTIGPSINNTNSNNSVKNDIKIDGADTAQIIRILKDILGNNAIKSTATATGKR